MDARALDSNDISVHKKKTKQKINEFSISEFSGYGKRAGSEQKAESKKYKEWMNFWLGRGISASQGKMWQGN